MDNGKDFNNSPEIIAMLEKLRHDIDADIERRKMAYIGKDGKDYYDKQSLDLANKMYQETMFPKIEKTDNCYYKDTESSRKMI